MRVLRWWYRRNKMFILFVMWVMAAYFVPAAFLKDTVLVLNVSGYILQISGLMTTIGGLLSIWKAYEVNSPYELIVRFFSFKMPAMKSGSGKLFTVEQTVLDLSPIKLEECEDRVERLERNIEKIVDSINNDRFTMRYLMETHKRIDKKIQKDVLSKVGELHRRSEKINLHGSGMTLTGLLWVGIGITQAAVAAYLSLML
ncbi:hypothetical protein SAMN03080615_00972 [Amphritea atlantica]|uniref:Uncharacterized protein n=2 Tax=Amphritea atlantica TaxID=355243 RepID=A0A1H9EMA5_9GAMM|nr:hypothetical protein SAMN03080615_00972 [Amphritea atlantica]